MDEYTDSDKLTRLQNSFAVGQILSPGGGWCSGTMISPHIFMTAAHCGGPDHATRTVRFFRIDEDAPNPASHISGVQRALSGAIVSVAGIR